MTSDAFESRARVLYEALKGLSRELPFKKPHKALFSRARDGYQVRFEDGSELALVVNRRVGGMPKGEFLASAGLALRDGPALKALAAASPAVAKRVQDPWLVGSSWYLVPRQHAKGAGEWDYRFVAGVDPEKLTKQVMADIKKYLFPMMHAFVEDYSKAADVLLTGKVEQLTLSQPFAIGLSILKLAGRLDEAEGLVARAASMKEKFYDYSPKNAEKLISLFRKQR